MRVLAYDGNYEVTRELTLSIAITAILSSNECQLICRIFFVEVNLISVYPPLHHSALIRRGEAGYALLIVGVGGLLKEEEEDEEEQEQEDDEEVETRESGSTVIDEVTVVLREAVMELAMMALLGLMLMLLELMVEVKLVLELLL